MKIGLVGYQGSGKSTLFHWLTGEEPDASLSHSGQSAMAFVPDARIAQLCEIYHPKKITRASIEIDDTPGLSRTHEGNAQRLGTIREAGCLILVIPAFNGGDPATDIPAFNEDLMMTDMEIVSSRIEKVKDTLNKRALPKAERDKHVFEQETLTIVLEALESGKPLMEGDLSEDQRKVTRAFRLLSEKPRMVIINTADDEENPERFNALSTELMPVVAVPIGLELELSKMEPEERVEFREEMGLGVGTDHDALIRQIMDASDQKLFLTAGEKEVRTWMIRKGATAVEAAGNIHTDMARGFIRAETMNCADLVRLGSERAIKAENLVRKEPKDYIVGDDDILLFHFSV